jgi:hypothetical protein
MGAQRLDDAVSPTRRDPRTTSRPAFPICAGRTQHLPDGLVPLLGRTGVEALRQLILRPEQDIGQLSAQRQWSLVI